jgi:hypothetical protein
MSENRPFCDEDLYDALGLTELERADDRRFRRLDAVERSARARLLEALGWFAIGAILAMPFAVLLARCGEAVQ